MNFSGYFCLVAAAVLVVFAQQSEAGAVFDKITNYIEDGLDAIENQLDPGIKRYRDTIAFIKQLVQENINANTNVDASIKIKEGFCNATQMLSSSRSIIVDGVLAAEKIVGKNPEEARKLMQQALVDGESIAYDTGAYFYGALGEALNLSHDGARQGLLSAINYIQEGGLALLSALKSGESLFNDGSEAGGTAAKAGLILYRLAIETGFADIFYGAEKYANESLQALRDAQSSPIPLRIENRSCGVATKDDPECSDALEDINQVANNALRNGANPALVQELKEIVKCALDSLVQVVTDVEIKLANVKKIAEIDTFAATTMVSKDAEALKKRVNQAYAQLYLNFGYVWARSGNLSAKEVQPAYAVLERGNVENFNTITFDEQIIMNGLENGGDASMLAFETVEKSIYFAKVLFIQSLVECVKVVLRLL